MNREIERGSAWNKIPKSKTVLCLTFLRFRSYYNSSFVKVISLLPIRVPQVSPSSWWSAAAASVSLMRVPISFLIWHWCIEKATQCLSVLHYIAFKFWSYGLPFVSQKKLTFIFCFKLIFFLSSDWTCLFLSPYRLAYRMVCLAFLSAHSTNTHSRISSLSRSPSPSLYTFDIDHTRYR